MKHCLKIVCFLLFYTGIIIPAKASHIVGGEITYQHMGIDGNGYDIYRIFLSIYEDCLNGSPDAILQDDPAYVKIFTGNLTSGNNIPFYPSCSACPSPDCQCTDSISYNKSDPSASFKVPANFSNACVKNPPSTCLWKKTFVKDYHLPPNPIGYIFVYQRCCRNASILNIFNPSSIGATYYCIIPPRTPTSQLYNNSAVFKNYPPQIICLNQPIFYDHSATDADGDSLSYEFCNTYAGGSDTNSKPVPQPPPFDPVRYNSLFSYTDPMGGYPQIQIDPVTGIITGTPKSLGRFVVTVCCHEWRNGININTLKREFQFVVTNCSKAVVADIPLLSDEPNTYIVDCADYTVHFLNTSIGGFAYQWYFDEPGATSTDFEPTYTYHDTGVFLVRLIVNPGSTCPDSIARLVKIFPKFKSVFAVTGIQCPGSLLNFYDSTRADYKPVIYWEYRFGDGDTIRQQNPTHAYTKGGTYYVTFISANIKGCSDTSLQEVLIDRFQPFAGNDTIIVQNEIINFHAGGGNKFTWSPSHYSEGTYLSDTAIYNPVGTFHDTGQFVYNLHVISPFGCYGDTTIKIWVVPNAAFFVPTAFTPNGDGRNDIFRPVPIGYRSLAYFRVYDRWGELLLESNSWEKGWDGTYKGQKLDAGVYYWEIATINRFGATEKKKGDVTLIR